MYMYKIQDKIYYHSWGISCYEKEETSGPTTGSTVYGMPADYGGELEEKQWLLDLQGGYGRA